MPLGASFDSILTAAREGAPWAWIEIYRDLAPAVLGYLRGRGADEPDDLLGQVFLDVVRGLRSFAGDERDFRAWVFTIAHRDLLDERRRRRRRPAEPALTESIAELVPGGDVEREAMDALGAERVRRALARLSPAQGEVLMLRVFGDLTIEEVARVVGKRPGAVKALQRGGIARILREFSRKGVPL